MLSGARGFQILSRRLGVELSQAQFNDIKDINTSFNERSPDVESNTSDDLISFDYKLIGYRSGPVDASVIVKKANKEHVVAIGEKLEGIYELIEVNQNEIIFRNDQKLYKIENLVGK